MQLASQIDATSIRKAFFDSCGEEFKRGASLNALTECSISSGVWAGLEDELAREGIQNRIRHWVQHAKDKEKRRIYHSLPSFDSAGKEIPLFKDVAFFNLDDYKTLFVKYEQRIRDHAHTYLELIHQCKERYGYKHKVPVHIQPLLDGME